MNETVAIPINFGNFSMQMFPSFDADEKLNSVKVIISHINMTENTDPIIFDLTDQVEQIDTSEIGSFPIKVKGEMYLDQSREKIIFDGFYSDESKNKGGSDFWLEIDPDYTFFKNSDKPIPSIPNLQCPPYPASIGSVQFDIDYSDSSASTGIDDSSKNVIFEIFQLDQNSIAANGEPSKTRYLSAILSPGKKITGIDTSDKSKLHLTDFAGDIGFVRNRVFIDGNFESENKVCCSFYLEISV
ncbi:hypothetical protein [Acetivibrio clariflavus]|uniref:hypothetical protein n=1 Tax=Acetivibrio clariflavus TaxID=288965 RepID=UPI000482CBC9|nr:hypothetical protein [Acetivibrio clariflavus]